MNRIIDTDNTGVAFVHEGQRKAILAGDLVRTADGRTYEVAAIADGSDAGARGDLLVHGLDGAPDILSPFNVSKIYREAP